MKSVRDCGGIKFPRKRKIDIIRELVDRANISDRMRHLIKTRPAKDVVTIFKHCETVADIEKECAEIEKVAVKVSEYVDSEYTGAENND